MHKATKVLWLVLTVLACSQFQCPQFQGTVDQQILQGSQQYFPEAEVWKWRTLPQMIHIQTHVGHVSRQFVNEVFQAFVQKKGREIVAWFPVVGYRWLSLDFEDFSVIWDVSAPYMCVILDQAQAQTWYMVNFGFVPQGEDKLSPPVEERPRYRRYYRHRRLRKTCGIGMKPNAIPAPSNTAPQSSKLVVEGIAPRPVPPGIGPKL